MTLARDWDFRDLTWYYWSEKFKGVRISWDGFDCWTRGGLRVKLPQWFRAELPGGVELDGEGWLGRSHGNELESQAAMMVVHGKISRRFKFKVFDAPGVQGDWAKRMKFAAQFANASVQPVEWGVVRHRDEASEIAARIIAGGGEGAMFRSPNVFHYQAARTLNLQRIKARNLYAPWHGAKKEYQRQHSTSGFDVGLLAHDPEIEWNIRQALHGDPALCTL